MDIPLNIVLQHNPNILQSQNEGAVFMMDKKLTQYFGVDSVGLRVWQLFEKGRSIEAVCDKLVDEFDIGMHQCLTDIKPFVNELLKHDMLVKCR